MVKNQAGQAIGAQMVNATNGSGYIGAVTVYVTGDAGTQALGTVGSGICTAEGNGYFTYRPSQAETNYTLIAFTFIGNGAVPATIQVATVTEAAQEAVTATSGILAYTVRGIITDALMEIGVLQPGETPDAGQAAVGLRRMQSLIDAWQADRLTLSLQLQTQFTWPASTLSVQVGVGQTVDMDRPMWIDTAAYIIPGTSGTTAIEVPLAILDMDQYAGVTIKQLSSALPQQIFYQTNLADGNGTLKIWPVPPAVDIVLYTPQPVGVPASLDSILQGPPGYQDAFLYTLAMRLVTPFGVNIGERCPALPQLWKDAMATMKRPNVQPGILGVDPALVQGAGAGYNVLSDSVSNWRH